MVLSVSVGGSSSNNEESDDNDPSSSTSSTLAQGRLLLFLVALLYGTLNVTLRFVYNTPLPNGAPISASALSAVRGWMATLCFIPLWLVYKPQRNHSPRPPTKEESTVLASTTTTTNDDIAALPFPPPPRPSSSLWKAALELAVWNFGAQGLLNIGLLTTGSARAAFLTQLSVVMTPLICILAGQVVSSTVWVASSLALAGLVLLSGGGAALSALLFGSTAATATTTTSAGLSSMLGTGDLYVLGAALCWSLYLFRLSGIGRRFNDIELQASKTILLAILYTVWFVWGSVSSSFGGGMAAFVASLTNSGGGGWLSFLSAVNPMIGLLLLYSAVGPGVVADVIQTQGQSKVSSASEANVILSMEPVFAAVCAFFILGEVTTLAETVGGGLILLAALVATRPEQTLESKEKSMGENQ
jgi:drug/metabolite transporter (DMT)-like permease